MDKQPSLPSGCKVEPGNTEPVFTEPVFTEPVFTEPWQARTFAMVVQLNEAGFFTWQEWAHELSRHIATAEKSRPIRDAAGYYEAWHACLEHLVNNKLDG